MIEAYAYECRCIAKRVALKTNAAAGEMNFSQICLAKDAGCLVGSQGFCKTKMAESHPPAGDESF